MSKDVKIKSSKKSMGKVSYFIVQLLLVILIIGGGVAGFRYLKHSRKPPERVEKERVAPLVKVETIRQIDEQMIIQGYGTVSPKVKVEIVPQVSGKVVAMDPGFRNGGFVKAGQAMIKIDPRDYELTVQSAEAEVAKASVVLDLEEAEGDMAKKEWDELNPGKEPPSQLVLRDPQIMQAKSLLLAAEAQLARAKLDLERTELTLSFDVRVVSENVDLGQYISSGQSLGVVYGIEAVEIEVPLEDWDLGWFDIPASPISINGNGNGKKGSSVEVIAEFSGGRNVWAGKVVRTAGEIDPTTRMVSVVVEVDDPFELVEGRPPLVPGMFVEVFIKGRVLKNTIPVPRSAIRGSKVVWCVIDGKLCIQEIEIARKDKDFAYVVGGLEDNVEIVVSSLDTVTEGMSVRTEKKEVLSDSNN
jgi:RND family efflux transporter MFP subunit